MQRRVFWISFLLISTFADVLLPFLWAIIVAVPLMFLCWWLAYKTDWFE